MPKPLSKEVYALIRQKNALYDLRGLNAVVDDLGRGIYERMSRFYAEQAGRMDERSFLMRSKMAATATNREAKTILEILTENNEYREAIREYLVRFDKIEKLTEKLHKEISNISTGKLIKQIEPAKKEIVSGIVNNLTEQGMNVNFVEPIKKVVYSNLVLGTNQTEAAKWLRDYIVGTEEKAGQLSRYVTQVTRDALNQYDGTINNVIRKEFELNAFRYVGSIIRDSREQCVRWVNQGVIMYDEIESEIDWAFNNGSGMIPGTNRDNFEVYRGGYNCRHEAIPFYQDASTEEG